MANKTNMMVGEGTAFTLRQKTTYFSLTEVNELH